MPRMLLTVLLAAAFAAAAAAQDFRAVVTGQVTDSSGGVIAGVPLRLINNETGVVVATTTSAAGVYTFPPVAPGAYRLEAEQTGFKKYVRESFTLQVQDRPVIDIVLEPGDLTAVITVTDEAPLVEAANASRGSVVAGRTLVDMPLNGRNAFALAALEPGVAITARGQASTFLRTTANNGISSVNIGGGQARSNEALLDGVPNTGSDGLIQFVPSVDATREFRVQTNVFDAEYGRFTGGVINAAIKSGTNEIHGTLFHFLRNSRLNARDPFAATIPQFAYNLFGGSAGGPVVLPKVYDGRNKTFWFVNYEGSREGVPRAFVSTVPTALQRGGNFSQTRIRSGANVLNFNLFDPLSTRQQGSTFVRDPFPGAVVPANRFNPISSRLINLYPDPNHPGDEVTGATNYRLSFKDPVRDDGYVVKMDHRFNDRHFMFARYSFRRFFVGRAREFRNDVNGDSESRDAPGLALDHTWVASPSTVLNFRYGLSRFKIGAAIDNLGTDMVALGFPPAFVSQLVVQAIPAITISNGFTPIANVNKLNRGAEDSHTLRASVTRTMAAHSLRGGVEARVLRSNSGSLGSNAAGAFSFDQVFTRGPNPQQNIVNAGHGLASFLLGFPAGGSVANNIAFAEQSPYYGFYVQDDWRVSRRLTLNFGLRYEWEGAYTERYDRLNRGFDYTTPSPISAAAREAYARNPIPEVPANQFAVLGGLLFANVGGQPRALADIDRNNIAPRFGAAYQLTPKTILRGGYGLFYGASTMSNESNNGFSVTTPYVASIDGNLTPLNNLSNPFPDGLRQPSGASEGLLTLIGQGVSYTATDRRMPIAQQYQFSIQRQLPGQILWETAYAGSRIEDLPVNRPMNIIPEQYRAAAEQTLRDTGRNVLNDAFPNPFRGLIASGPLAGATVTRGQLLRPFPHFTGITEIAAPIGSSRFDSLQVKINKRMSHGLAVTSAYTWGKFLERARFLNDQDARPVKELNANDIPHRLVVSGIYELPFGPGKTIGGQTRGFAARLIENMQLNVVYMAQGGVPLEISGAESVGRSAKLPKDQRTVDNWFDRTAFRLRQPLELTKTARLPDVRSGGKNNFDISFFKTTQITESVRLQFRAESFNAMNRPEWSSPTTAFTNANFTRVLSTNTFNRQFQFALKLLW